MGLSDEGEHMVLAKGEQFDVLDDDHLAVGLREDGRTDDFFAVLPVSLGQELHRLRHPFRGLGETFPLRILSEELENGLDVSRDLVCGLFVVFLYLSVCHGIVFAASSTEKWTAKLKEEE